MDYNIQTITQADREKVLNFLRKFFFRDEPLNHCIGLIPEGENSTCIELEDYSMSAMSEDFSFMAVTANGSVIGVILNGSMGPISKEEPHYIVNCANPKFKKILKLLYCVEKNSNIPEKFPDQKVLEIRIISVDSKWRGKGIAKALFEKTMEVAKNRGFDIIRVDCSSAITGKLCQRLSFEPVFELKYADYVDEAGNPIFKPAPPHEAEVTYVKKVPQSVKVSN
ncbi:dopamine N-acetyltransferase-like isoform X2 [Belonocnema kinseyi]|nr:dopamine N-acetyltransferase-like isoform X2 [Belonocnema kinseyi]XP_033207600.1 dopamine N-acetyltransferase-like isoform X2 [Belonocnema kinseyi]XP_033207601.1 dopamine N-acetyltransferase-like isoform X2 [Belonocnema kinseyi]XP_033207602.1 dopamine N-acetyltransferase-like isoform X2 [Belonocnema kinseyi]XP_033207603.1 dopamine N-acetyltransferase-like isoform X2 [Belonocnema kinseyi]